ncbi:hypothetical protein GCM10028791_21970 [Echinicola sediminis]
MKKYWIVGLVGMLALTAAIIAVKPKWFNPKGSIPLRYQFPQGVASADPQPGAIMLWTRIVPSADSEKEVVEANVQVSLSRSFEKLIHEGRATTGRDADFTLRYFATGLPKGKKVFYRFIAGSDTSRTGRTFTAPAAENPASLNYATIACSSYEQGFFGTLKTMIEEDKSRPEKEQLHMVFHLGDFIYEVVGDDPRQDNHHPNWLVDRQGKERSIPPFPDGKQWPDSDHWKSGSWSPVTLADYRHLYKTYLSDPIMQEARARWPFVYTWDDHEFADGGHQSKSYIADMIGLPGMQKVKVAANQAWFEYLPAALSDAQNLEGVKNEAHDFIPTAVENRPIPDKTEQGIYSEPNNIKAINSMGMYRAFQWGKDVLIIVTDNKSYQLPGVSVLGVKQKKWFKTVLKSSKANWKLWANSEPFQEVLMDFDNVPELHMERKLLYNDSWKDCSDERAELLSFIQSEAISGLVSLSADYHIHMAGLVEGLSGKPVMADLAVGALSSFPDFFWLARRGQGADSPLLEKLYVYAEHGNEIPNINNTVLYGSQYALGLASGMEGSALDPDRTINPHLMYFDCQYNGYMLGQAASEGIRLDFVNTSSARVDPGEKGAEPLYRKRMYLRSWGKNEFPKIELQ